MVMFPDNPCRALSIALKQYYLCNTEENVFLVNDGVSWLRVDKGTWLDSIQSCSQGINISPIIPRLENKEACRRIIMM